jgi:hypothetical protein
MTALSYAYQAFALDAIFGSTDPTPPATYYLALFTDSGPTAAGGGTEVTGTGYARVAVANNSTNFPNASGTPATQPNGTAVTFPTAGSDWGTVESFAWYDAATSGNLVAFGPVSDPTDVASGDTAIFAIGALVASAV